MGEGASFMLFKTLEMEYGYKKDPLLTYKIEWCQWYCTYPSLVDHMSSVSW